MSIPQYVIQDIQSEILKGCDYSHLNRYEFFDKYSTDLIDIINILEATPQFKNTTNRENLAKATLLKVRDPYNTNIIYEYNLKGLNIPTVRKKRGTGLHINETYTVDFRNSEIEVKPHTKLVDKVFEASEKARREDSSMLRDELYMDTTNSTMPRLIKKYPSLAELNTVKNYLAKQKENRKNSKGKPQVERIEFNTTSLAAVKLLGA
jgi:hypothetical protein